MMMKINVSVVIFLTIWWAVFAFAFALADHPHHSHPEKDFLHCLKSSDDATITKIVYTPKDPDFISILNFYIQNSRFMNITRKPRVIVEPFKESQVQTVIKCGKSSGLQVRVRSGGHDHEGSSYISDVPFFILDINKFRSISVDDKSKTIWFGAGSTLGEIYYAIYEKNDTLSVALGSWPTVGVGGFISGGGYGGLTRQYGVGADQVIDAIVVDVNGEIHDRKSMGEDFFWAIRGGNGANFGVILAYKLRLVDVSVKAAVFSVNRTLEENAVQLVYKWQKITPKLPLDLSLSVHLRTVVSKQNGQITPQASFICAYRGGGVDELLSIMEQNFPELGIRKEDVFEILWIQYLPFQLGFPLNDFARYLTSRIPPAKPYYKAISDLPKDPIPESGIQGLMHKLLEVPPDVGQMEWTFWGGGVMDKIPVSEIAFPHRGNLFIMMEVVYWNKTDSPAKVEKRINWLRQLHSYSGNYVPNNPRPAYANYRDNDLGVNNPYGTTTVEQARSTWGGPYYGKNFDRLVRVKTKVDPQNYFQNDQSFPLLTSKS